MYLKPLALFLIALAFGVASCNKSEPFVAPPTLDCELYSFGWAKIHNGSTRLLNINKNGEFLVQVAAGRVSPPMQLEVGNYTFEAVNVANGAKYGHWTVAVGACETKDLTIE